MGLVIVALLTYIPLGLFRAWVLKVVYDWYLFSHTHFEVSFLMMLGISVMYMALTIKVSKESDDATSLSGYLGWICKSIGMQLSFLCLLWLMKLVVY